MTKAPKLSVIMGVYNTEAFLAKTLDNLLAQSFSDFELICVNDASTDGSLSILQAYAAKDPRIKIIELPENKGVANARNKAAAVAAGTYIAIADSDDTYLPHRFEKQVGFLEAHPDYVAVGSSILFTDIHGTVFYHEPMPEKDIALRWRMMFDSPLPHAATTVRASAYQCPEGPYKTEMHAAEDYDMWPRVMARGKACNLKDPMILYRQHGASVSHARIAELIANRDVISQKLLKEGIGDHGLTLEEVNRLRHIFFNGFHTSLLMPETKDIENLAHCFRLFTAKMSRADACQFLDEEQAFLGYPYLSKIGLGNLRFASFIE